ncbi:uncharacterized protein LOC126369703 [Pectinophora gossypiella]|uniref:Uncharacterized protein n=1 Tax=Pectinophora gossypiella TaxID=13191 RepID=A0A1E1WDV8_PECGO|nr:uncharacterized protein LOC126369703 [Pectinophora gossypiella]
MNTHLLVLGVLLCLMAVDARHFGEQADQVSTDDDQAHVVKARESGDRHRRKRYHINYGYDYQPPANPFYPPYRRESYDRNPDLLPEIYRLLDEISAYVRRPQPPPPQPIYIPYAVPYPICNCPAATPTAKPNITNRFPEMDDSNQNWGLVDEGTQEEEGDGSRPLSFTPITPKRPLKRPQVNLEHGTQHGREAAASPSIQARVPVMCDVFSLSCCGNGSPAQQRECLISNGCPETYDNGRGCSQERLLKIIDAYSKAYAPV